METRFEELRTVADGVCFSLANELEELWRGYGSPQPADIGPTTDVRVNTGWFWDEDRPRARECQFAAYQIMDNRHVGGLMFVSSYENSEQFNCFAWACLEVIDLWFAENVDRLVDLDWVEVNA